MKITKLFISSLLVVALSAPKLAEKLSIAELATPLIELIPAFKKVRSELKLDEKQSKTVDAWMAEAPVKKAELKQNVLMARAELKVNLENANRKVIEMESLCARMLHTTLNKEQYAKVVAQYRASVKS